jgi:hypothetical protein
MRVKESLDFENPTEQITAWSYRTQIPIRTLFLQAGISRSAMRHWKCGKTPRPSSLRLLLLAMRELERRYAAKRAQ